jgi:hypothetical protein
MSSLPAIPLLATALLFAAAPALRALTIAGYNATLDERFSSGFPTAPAANPDFQYASLDFSGVGWRDDDTRFGVTLVSEQNFVTATHMAPAIGSTVSFVSNAGVLHTYTVSAIAPMLFADGVASDLTIGTFTETVSTDLNIYRVLDLNTLPPNPNLTPGHLAASALDPYLGLNLLFYGQTGRVGGSVLGGFTYADFNAPFTPESADPVPYIDSLFSVMIYNSAERGSSMAQGGDSGSPTFVVINGELVLISVHSAIDTESPTNYDTPLFPYTAHINPELGQTGHSLHLIPAPSATALILAALSAALLLTRRKKLRRLPAAVRKVRSREREFAGLRKVA